MGHGVWTSMSFNDYSAKNGRTVAADGSIRGSHTVQEMYRSTALSPVLNPRGVIRECCETEEHPDTLPVILALDVTGSMGSSAVEIAKKLNNIMTGLYTTVQDVEFMIMGIGDVMYDRTPVQASQFESDIRIAEQLDQLYFEGGGGGNQFESYTAAWYFAARHTRLDCWKRGRKGLIITIGDELINPYIPVQGRYCSFAKYMGDELQGDIESSQLLKEVGEKYELYHLSVDHSSFSHSHAEENADSFAQYIGRDHVSVVTLNSIADRIVDIIVDFSKSRSGSAVPNVAPKKGLFSGLLNTVSW